MDMENASCNRQLPTWIVRTPFLHTHSHSYTCMHRPPPPHPHTIQTTPSTYYSLIYNHTLVIVPLLYTYYYTIFFFYPSLYTWIVNPGCSQYDSWLLLCLSRIPNSCLAMSMLTRSLVRMKWIMCWRNKKEIWIKTRQVFLRRTQ